VQRPLASFLLVLLVACRPAPPAEKPHEDDEGEADSNQAPADEGEAGEGGDDGGAPLPGPTLPTGPLCDTDADCGEGMLCEGVGCEAGQGRCVVADRICTRDLAQYCGCDNQLFETSGSCPGRRYAYRGPCDPKLADGEPCTDGHQCSSGQCIGDGLEGCSRGAQGVCGVAPCTRDLQSYCGCNNVEFQSSGSCPNRQFAYRGPCEN
jgi:hypothetical protein